MKAIKWGYVMSWILCASSLTFGQYRATITMFDHYLRSHYEFRDSLYVDVYYNNVRQFPPNPAWVYTYYQSSDGGRTWQSLGGGVAGNWRIGHDDQIVSQYLYKASVQIDVNQPPVDTDHPIPGPNYNSSSLQTTFTAYDGSNNQISGLGTGWPIEISHYCYPDWVRIYEGHDGQTFFLGSSLTIGGELVNDGVMRAFPFYLTSTGQGFHDWRDAVNQSYFLDHNTFTVGSAISQVNAHYQNKVQVTIAVFLTDGSNNGAEWVQIQDPWLVDNADPVFLESPYGYHNLYMNAPFKTESSPLVLSPASKYNGVFLGQGSPNWNPPYYSVSAPVQLINGSTAFFGGWSCTPGGSASFKNSSSSATTGIIFYTSGSTVTANYSYYTVPCNNTIPAGIWTIAGTLTVPAGVTLTVSSGATLRFPSGTGLTVNGTLNATGATFTSISGTWNGITLNASNSTLSGCTVSSASNGVTYSSGSTGSIQECTIQNCTNGIVVQGNSNPNITSNTATGNSSYGIFFTGNGTATPTVFANSVTSNGTGIMFANSSALIRNNSISSNYRGIWCANYSSPTSGSLGQRGNNTITGNTYGIMTRVNSYPGIGTGNPYRQQFYGVCNTIMSNSSYDAYASNVSGITARFDYWGGYSPRIYYSGDSYVDNLYMNSSPTSCPLAGGSSAVMLSMSGGSNSKDDTSSLMEQAMDALMDEVYPAAQYLYSQVLRQKKLSRFHPEALSRLYSIFVATKDSSILDLFSDLQSSDKNLSREAEELLALSYAGIGRLAEAAVLAQDLKTRYSDTLAQQQALLLLVSLRGFDREYSSVSKAAFHELVTEYGNSLDRGFLVGIRASDDVTLPDVQAQGSAATAGLDSSAVSLSSFPNPFNPSTQIRFTVKQAGLVSLKIFDLLGRQVETLVNEFKSQGAYSVNWNANQLATGIYFARFEATGKVSIQKLLYLK